MPESKFYNDIIIVQKHWNDFIQLIKSNLNDLYVAQRRFNREIRRIQRISILLEHSQDNIEFLLSHKESIISLDSSLNQKFVILEAFQKRNNLSNAVAIRTFNEILNSEHIKKTINKLGDLRKEKENIDNQINQLLGLVNGTNYNRDIILEYAQKYGLDSKAQVSLIFYPILKSAKKPVQKNNKKSAATKKDTQSDIPKSETIKTPSDIEEVPNYKDEFDEIKKEYEIMKNRNNMFLNKYYFILQSMTPTESQYYYMYCSMTSDELNSQKFEGEYDEAMAKIIALKLFDIKREIEEAYFKNIPNSNYTNKEDIEFLKEYIKEFQNLMNELQSLDKKITDKRKKIEEFENQKAFFLTNRSMQPFIPDFIREKTYIGSFVNILNKAQDGHIQNKNGSNIMPLKVSKKFNEVVGRTVLSVRNSKIIVSYIKLNSGTGLNDGGILIITTSLLHPNTIQEDTDKVIKENIEQLIRQINLIEKGNPLQLGLQASLRDEFIRKENPESIKKVN